MAFRWSGRKQRLVTILLVFAVLAALSGLGAALAHHADPAAWDRAFAEKFGG